MRRLGINLYRDGNDLVFKCAISGKCNQQWTIEGPTLPIYARLVLEDIISHHMDHESEIVE